MDKNLQRIEAKLDALLKEHSIKPEDVKVAAPAARAPAPLTPQQQAAIDNAPKTPTGSSGPAANAPRVEASTNAPVTPTPPVPPEAIGPVTVETTQADGTTTVQTKDAGARHMSKP